jgi:hypothetical protein
MLAMLLSPAFTLAALLSPRVPTATTPAQVARCSPYMSGGGESGELERMLRQQARDLTQAKFGVARSLLKRRETVFVLLFNRNRPNEGVYTLQGHRDSADTYMVAFEDAAGADRFAGLLSAEGFDEPQPTQWSSEQLVSFCDTGGFHLGFVPTEALLLPPKHNVFSA